MKKITHSKRKRQPKIKIEMNGKGLTVHAGLLPVLTFMEKLYFVKAIEAAVHKKRGANAVYQFSDVIQMTVLGIMAGATALAQVVKVAADEVLRKMAGWESVPEETTLGRVIKLADGHADLVGIEGINHRLRGKVWKKAIRSGHRLRSAISVMWLDIDSTVEGVCGNQEGAEKGYNPNKKGQKSYHPLIAFVSERIRGISQLV